VFDSSGNNKITDIFDIIENEAKDSKWDPDRFRYLDDELMEQMDLNEIRINIPTKKSDTPFNFAELHCLANVYDKIDAAERKRFKSIVDTKPYAFEILDMNMIVNIPLYNIKTLALIIIDQFVKNGVDRESRILGTNFVLCALTLVSEAAAEALPWLYQSVAIFI
jgi:hypothetical protein